LEPIEKQKQCNGNGLKGTDKNELIPPEVRLYKQNGGITNICCFSYEFVHKRGILFVSTLQKEKVKYLKFCVILFFGKFVFNTK